MHYLIDALIFPKEHRRVVMSICFSSCGNYIVSGSIDKFIIIWDAKSNKLIRKLSGHREAINSVAYSSNNQFIVSSSDDTTVKIWNCMNGQEVRTLRGHKARTQIAKFNPTNTHIASGSYDHTIRIWDVQSGHTHKCLPKMTNFVKSLVYTNNGEYLIIGCYNSFCYSFNTTSYSMEYQVDSQCGAVYNVSVSPNDQYFVASVFKYTKLYDVLTGTCVKTFDGHSELVNCNIFSKCGKYIISVSDDKKWKVWDFETSKCVHTQKDHIDYIYCLDMSPCGSYFVTGSDNKLRKFIMKY